MLYCALLALSLVLLAAPRSEGAFCNMQSNQTGLPNLIPVDRSKPIFVKRVPNGERYTVGSGQDQLSLLHLYGSTGYANGFATGQLMGPEATAVLHGAWNYFKGMIEQQIAGAVQKYNLSQAILNLIAEVGLEVALDIQNLEAADFMKPHWYDEMQGLSDATGIDVNMIKRVHLVGEITRGDCSFYGLWGSATQGGNTLQLRALDWDLGAGLQNHPTVTIYHPQNPTQGAPFANVGWAGWIGTLTGMSARNIGISEIGIDYPDSTWGNESYIGIPFVFLERLILEQAHTYKEAESIINNATRTCRLVLGVGDGNSKTARMVQYSHSIVRYFKDTDLEPLTWWHPRIPNTVYCGMDWKCPYYQHLLANQLQAMHGSITPELSIMNITSVVQTGDLHAAVYDLTESHLFVANARGDNETMGARQAYARQWVKIDLSQLWKKPYGKN